MTLAEVERAIESQKRVNKVKRQDKAVFDYTLSLMIGRNIARILNSNNTIPTLTEAYPNLFETTKEEQEELQQAKDEISAIRFRLFAQSHNKKYEGGELNK